MKIIRQGYFSLERYIKKDPVFYNALKPHPVAEDAPEIVRKMAKAGKAAGVGPMAAVAGAMAESVGKGLLPLAEEIIVENGGDIFWQVNRARTIGIFAGTSPFSEKIGITLPIKTIPYGICTSSGTVGPSLSFGKADAVTILALSTALADAVATAAANLVQEKDDVKAALDFARRIKGVVGVVVIKDDRLAVWGELEIVRLGNLTFN